MSTLVYSEDFKQQVVRDIELGLYSMTKARVIHKIGGKMTVKKWIEKYGKSSKLQLLIQTRVKKMNKEESLKQRIKELENQLMLKEKALESSEIQALLYKTVIEVMEEETGQSIKKKYGIELLKKSKKSDK